MKNNFKQRQNNPTGQDLELQKSTKWVSFINLLLFKLGIINFLILTYFYFQQDIRFIATGWFPMPEKSHWYEIFLGLIVLRMIIVFIIHQLTRYINDFSLRTQKEKKMHCTY